MRMSQIAISLNPSLLKPVIPLSDDGTLLLSLSLAHVAVVYAYTGIAMVKVGLSAWIAG